MEFILWADKKTHDTISSQPDFPATYQKLVDLLVEDPVWNSGEVITQHTNVAV